MKSNRDDGSGEAAARLLWLFGHIIVSGGRGPTITHRQPGNIEDVEFRDIEFLAQHHAARWWGWGEAASITAWTRKEGTKLGSLSNIRLRNIHGVAENSFRVDAHPEMLIKNVP